MSYGLLHLMSLISKEKIIKETNECPTLFTTSTLNSTAKIPADAEFASMVAASSKNTNSLCVENASAKEQSSSDSKSTDN
jgi:hypothetical protein